MIRVCTSEDLAEGQIRQVIVEGRILLLYRGPNGIRICDGICPHRGALLSQGEVDAGAVTCPWHGWAFDLETGQGLTNPMSALRTYEALEQDGDVCVEQGD